MSSSSGEAFTARLDYERIAQVRLDNQVVAPLAAQPHWGVVALRRHSKKRPTSKEAGMYSMLSACPPHSIPLFIKDAERPEVVQGFYCVAI